MRPAGVRLPAAGNEPKTTVRPLGRVRIADLSVSMVIMAGQQRKHVHLTHWGTAEIESDGRRITSVRPWREDPHPSPTMETLAAPHGHPARVDQPDFRQGWLEHR